MSVDAHARLRRWRGVIWAGALAAAAVALFGRAALSGAPLPMAMLAATLLVSAQLGRDGWRRARLTTSDGPGVVMVREGQIVYFGPDAGGAVDLDALNAVIVEPGGVWQLRATEAATLRIPMAATGAEALLDAFAALPGFDPGRAAPDAAAPTIVWRRATPPQMLGQA
ncbi:MAG: hypothetical protein ACK4WC_03340 [Rubrimonas sp.]